MKTSVIFVCFFTVAVAAVGLKGDNQQYSVSINGPKSVPITGLLLQGNRNVGSDSGLSKKLGETVLSGINNLNQAVKGISDKIDSLDARLKDVSKSVQTLADSNGEGYIGCYRDNGSRHLKHKYASMGNQITLAKCKENCRGYKYAGLQNSNQCFCGNTLINKEYPRVSDKECNKQCRGEPNRMCGGSWRNSIYKV